MADISEDFLNQVAALYEYAGLTHLLGALQTVLLRQYADAERLNFDTQELVYELAQLKKAGMPLTDAERIAVRQQGILWTPRTDPA
jgi:hypothetical protein